MKAFLYEQDDDVTPGSQSKSSGKLEELQFELFQCFEQNYSHFTAGSCLGGLAVMMLTQNGETWV